MNPILSGISLGILLAFLVGPVFFLIIDVGIKHGLRSAIPLVAGVAFSDAMFMALTAAGASVLGWLQNHQVWVGRTGGLLLIVFGLSFLFRKPHLKSSELSVGFSSPNAFKEFVKGFMLNVLNPFVLIFWIGVAATVTGREYSTAETVQFYGATLVTVFATDLSKAALARKLEHLMTPVRYRRLHQISGIGLMLFGLRLLWVF
ncbi:MAG: LysE family transporter [Sphingobacteriales bacterium]|jgi:threonine/homoserine/homoserine lactone efflux protein|nr:LysE family transporter [Sphingobacteriales bacterium]